MGKDQELLDAARNGNVSVVEKILSQKARRSGPLASLRRGPGANVQDNSGYTPLHHSALNGHKDIVLLLLAHDASPNVTDHKGSSPLHLAAWTGNTEIVKLLLVQSNVQPNVNLTNSDGETPLHCAAQYGHVDVVNLLLQNNCDPTICNTKEETALDLAAQYGRLETVETLVKTHPELLTSSHTKRHSALHLASRNGHKPVVQVLLNSGFPVGTLTETGSALHEAATFGKVDVVRVLLENGVDLEAEDSHRRSVMDILEDLKTFKSQEIASVIQNHSTLITTAEHDLQNANPPPPQFASRAYENVTLPKWASVDGSPTTPVPGSLLSTTNSSSVYQVPPRTPRSLSVDTERRTYGTDIYQVPPTPEPLESSFEGSDMSVTSSIYQTPPPPRELDAMSIGSSYYETPPTPREVGKSSLPTQRTSLPEDQALLYQIPPPPREVLKRMSDPSHSGTPLRNSCGPDQNSELFHRQFSLGAGYVPMGPVHTAPKFLRPPLKPPRKNVSPHSPTKYQVHSGPPGVAYEYLYLASSGVTYDEEENVRNEKDHSETDVPFCKLPPGTKFPVEYVDMKIRHSFVPNYENEIPYFKNRKCGRDGSGGFEEDDERIYRLSSDGSSAYENVPRLLGRRSPANMKVSQNSRVSIIDHRESGDGNKVAKPNSLELQVKKRIWDDHSNNITRGPPTDDAYPLSPSGYQQPPTPDFPPPSPGTAETGIHEKMRPLSKEYKRRSRDNETATEDEVFELIQHEHGAVTLQVVTREHKSVSTENIEEVKDDVPFAGLHRGSKIQSSSSDDTCDESNYYTPCSLSSPSDWSDHQQIVSHNSKSRQGLRKQANVYENVSVDMNPHTGHRHLTFKAHNGSQYENVEFNSVLSPFDENAEWAKINDIMATFSGGFARSRNTYRESSDVEPGVHHHCPGSRRSTARDVIYQLSAVGKWLSKLGVGEYENLFLINGYDDLDFMGGDMIEETDLIEMRITNPDHRRIILDAVQSLPAVKAIGAQKNRGKDTGSRQFETVDEWLRSIHLEFYADTFHRHKYGDMERVMKMWEVELTTILEITRPGHKKRILLSLGERPVGPRIYDDVNELNCELTNLKHEINQLDQLGKSKPEANPNGTLRKRNGSHKPPAPPPPPRRSSSKSPCDPNGNKDGFSAATDPSQTNVNGIESIIIRDPCQLFTGIPTSLTTQWRHKLEDFVSGCCNYTAKYLGSTLIKELKGVESSKKSIQKLKNSTSDIGKVPNVMLSISYKGVKFIDATTKNEVCEHEICNINCACQDADDLNHFAYITKDHLTGNHYCHVFSVATMEMATEIILTLGQAFEVAYQIALRDKNLQSSNGHVKKQQCLGSHQPPLFSPKSVDQTFKHQPAQMVSGDRQ